MTYRVFTDGETVLNALKKVFFDAQANGKCVANGEQLISEHLTIPGQSEEGILSPRRTSGASSVSGNTHIQIFQRILHTFNKFDRLALGKIIFAG